MDNEANCRSAAREDNATAVEVTSDDDTAALRDFRAAMEKRFGREFVDEALAAKVWAKGRGI